MAKIVTKTGDTGSTGIFGGERIPKDSVRIEANGAMDELNSHLGLIRSLLTFEDPLHTYLGGIQRIIMQLMSLIATPSDRREENPNRFDPTWLGDLEQEIERMMKETPNNGFFILPGGTPLSAHIQIARTIARRAERRLWTLEREDALPDGLIAWVNRLSDYLFVLAKWEMFEANCSEDIWKSFAYKSKRGQSK